MKQKTSEWLELVLEYAAYLGMDADQDEELMWIAEQALRAPVPEGWEELMDPMGNLYFYNEGTMQTTRQHPMDGCYLLWPYLLWPYLPWPTCHGSTHHGYSSYSFHVPWSYDLHTVAYLLWPYLLWQVLPVALPQATHAAEAG